MIISCNRVMVPQNNEQLAALIEQVRQALQKDENETVSILLEDQSNTTLQYLFSQLTPSLRDKLQKIVKQFESSKQEKCLQQKHEDAIRRINRQSDSELSSSSDCLFNETSRKAKRNKTDDQEVLKLEKKSGFEFYGNVKCLMIAYGDLAPLEPAIKMMHSQLELLFRQLMDVVRGGKAAQSANSISITSSFEFKEFLKPIFPEDEKDFSEIFRIYRKIKTHGRISKSNLPPENSSDSSSRKQSDDDFPSSESKTQKPAEHMRTKDVEEMEYLVEITNNMQETEYRQYCSCRSVNFLMHKKSPEMQNKLRQFIDTDSILNKQVFLVHVLQFLSFLACRFIKRIIYNIIRQRSYHQCGQRKLIKMSRPLQPQEITQIGNAMLDQYSSKIQSTIKSAHELSGQAERVFIDEFCNQKLIQEIFPKPVLNRYKGSPQKMWSQCQHYRKMWEQRLKGEREITHIFRHIETNDRAAVEQIVDKVAFGDTVLKNEYSRVIVKNQEQYFLSGGSEQKQKIERMKVFRKYVMSEKNEVFEEERSRRRELSSRSSPIEVGHEEITGKKPRKRKQLESLKQ